jgi:UDP-N-acetylmuramoyl-L-alanyl-D-glutamate--2,6-diaminopimelate ligase
VVAGSVFGAFKGAVFNGEDFIDQRRARRRGGRCRAQSAGPDVPHLSDAEPRRLFAQLASRFYGRIRKRSSR